MITLISLLACTAGNKEIEDSAANQLTAPALAEKSGTCPDVSSSGQMVTMESSGEERNVTVVFPEESDTPSRVIFFFHGLAQVNSNPSQQTAQALNLQSWASANNAIIVLPESPVWSIPLAGDFHMWDVKEGESAKDVQLFDDLRTCIAESFTVDLNQIVLAGFSGGALFNTVLLGERAESIAAAVSFSGGADVDIAIFEEMIAPYSTPASSVPVLLVAGGEQDIWPDPSFTLVDFVAATDLLQEQLVTDGHTVVRCDHSRGHTIPMNLFEIGQSWLLDHSLHSSSPYDEAIPTEWSSCYLASE